MNEEVRLTEPVVKIIWDDCTVTLAGDDEFHIEVGDGWEAAKLNDERLGLIEKLIAASAE